MTSANWMLASMALCAFAACENNGIIGSQDRVVHSVDMIDHRFEPATLTIEPNEVVRWTNRSKEVHTVTCDLPPTGVVPFASPEIIPDGSRQHVFKEPGTYKYYCRHHAGAGMYGEIIVQAKGPREVARTRISVEADPRLN